MSRSGSNHRADAEENNDAGGELFDRSSQPAPCLRYQSRIQSRLAQFPGAPCQSRAARADLCLRLNRAGPGNGFHRARGTNSRAIENLDHPRRAGLRVSLRTLTTARDPGDWAKARRRPPPRPSLTHADRVAGPRGALASSSRPRCRRFRRPIGRPDSTCSPGHGHGRGNASRLPTRPAENRVALAAFLNRGEKPADSNWAGEGP